MPETVQGARGRVRAQAQAYLHSIPRYLGAGGAVVRIQSPRPFHLFRATRRFLFMPKGLTFALRLAQNSCIMNYWIALPLPSVPLPAVRARGWVQ